jgi:hypothetical protein
MGNLENICDKYDSISINTPLNTSTRHIYSQEREKTNLYFPEKFEKLRANKRQPNQTAAGQFESDIDQHFRNISPPRSYITTALSVRELI